MSIGYLTEDEKNEITNRQLYSLENGISKGNYSLKEIGDLVPGAIIVHEMESRYISYMNNWGCETLNHSMDEINAMGEEYYKKFFFEEEVRKILPGMIDFYKHNDHTDQYCFFHQVRTLPRMEFSWHYAVAKFLRRGVGDEKTTELIMVVNPIAGMGLMINKVNKLLDENLYVAKNYKRFATLSKREKEIITLLAEGKSTPAISEILFISQHTVSTHRRNINTKLDIKNASELLKFAAAFELVK